MTDNLHSSGSCPTCGHRFTMNLGKLACVPCSTTVAIMAPTVPRLTRALGVTRASLIPWLRTGQ
jgi:hypothetical protein